MQTGIRSFIPHVEAGKRLVFAFLAVIATPLASTPLLAADAGLPARARQIFGPPLPQIIAAESNPVTPEKVRLGKMLYYETRVSIDGTVSCARCHPLGLYGADGLKKSLGNHDRPNPRNAPTVLNAAGQIAAHWIGNRKDVEDQATQALTGPPSFGMPSYQAAENILRAITGYPPLFRKAFPGDADPVRAENFGKAIGAFERTLTTPAPFDRFLKGDRHALTDSQLRGLRTFIEVGCSACHAGTYVGGSMYRKFGILEPYWQATKSAEIDEGRFEVTKKDADKYVFKVPILRNVAMTAPYFHDGSVDHLADAVRIMARVQLGRELTAAQRESLVSFLASLTGTIPKKALTLPLLPPGD